MKMPTMCSTGSMKKCVLKAPLHPNVPFDVNVVRRQQHRHVRLGSSEAAARLRNVRRSCMAAPFNAR